MATKTLQGVCEAFLVGPLEASRTLERQPSLETVSSADSSLHEFGVEMNELSNAVDAVLDEAHMRLSFGVDAEAPSCTADGFVEGSPRGCRLWPERGAQATLVDS